MNQNIAEDVSTILLSIGAVSFNTEKPFRYASGILSPMYTDNRLLISHPKEWKKIIGHYIAIMKEAGIFDAIDVLSGTATAAIPHAAALAYELNLPMVYVRSSKKEHGKENQIEGTFPKKSHVLIVEDLISTGGSAKTNCLAVRQAGGSADTCIAITTSTLSAFEKNMEEISLRLLTLTNVQTTLQVAAATKKISRKDIETVREFLTNPGEWGKKMGFE